MTTVTAALKSQRETALAKADSIVKSAERAGNRPLTRTEASDVSNALAEAETVRLRIQSFNSTAALPTTRHDYSELPAKFSRDYASAFQEFLLGGNVRAALNSGSDSAGGYAVPITVDGAIVPLAPEGSAMRQISTIITTAGDLKLPIQATKSTAVVKTQAGAFTPTGQTLQQKTITAYMVTTEEDISLEISQDTKIVDSLIIPDISDEITETEENLFINGSGTGEPEGVLTGADFGVAHAELDLDAILDQIGTLKARYLKNATFLMKRSTGIAIRKLALTSNLAGQVWSRDADGTERLLNYPVAYSESMGGTSQGDVPLLLGDFKRGFVIGDRGGSAIFLKILDQTKMLDGVITVLAYRRTDSRVRRSEALKTFVIDSAS